MLFSRRTGGGGSDSCSATTADAVPVTAEASKRWVFQVDDYDRITTTVIASEFDTIYPVCGEEGLAMVAFYDHHPAAPDIPIFQIRANFVKSITVVREANQEADEPVAAWTSASALPRLAACSESVQ